MAALGALVIAAVLSALLHVSAQPASGSEGSDPVNADTPPQSQEATATAAATGTDPPAKPTALEASAVHDAVTLTWTASTDQTVTHYAILRRNPDTDALGVFHVIESNAGGEASDNAGPEASDNAGGETSDNAGPETSYTDSSVSASSTYIYRVKSVSPTGVSQWSGYVKVETPAAPDPPLTPSTTSAPPLTPSTTSAPPPPPTTTSAPAPELVPAPEDLRPTGLTVELVENRVTLSWTAPKEDAESVDGYEILRRRPYVGESALATLVADTESTATAYSDATANEAGVRYVYRVKALRGDDASLWSNFDRVDLPSDYEAPQEDEPESASDDLAPTGLSASLVDGGGVALSWAAPAEDAESVTGYEILRAAGEGELATLVADTASTATAYSDATATVAGEAYAYEVKAIRGEDRSQASGEAEVQVPHDPVDLAPTGLSAVVWTVTVAGEEEDTGVYLTWTAPAADAGSVTGYEVLRAVGEGEITTLVDDTASTATFYIDATATVAGETYAYEVKAIRGEDRSQASGQVEVQLPHDPVDLAPSNLTAEKVDGGVALSWTAPAEDADSVTGYEVLRATGEGELTTLVADTASTATAYSDATATDATETYTYEVKAIRGEDRSRASGEAQVAPPAAVVVAVCEFDAGGSDLPADTGTACVLEVGGSVRGETGAAGDVDWYRVGLQAGVTYQFDMRGKSTGGWQLVDGAPAYVSVGTLEDPKLLGVYDASGALVAGSDSEAAGTGKDSRIASFGPGAGGVYYISASAEGAWTGTYELSLAVTAGDNAEDLALLAPGGLEVTMVRNRLNLSWAAPAADADSVTGYEILRAAGEAEPATLVADTASTSTTYRDDTATEAGVSYTYAVKALRGGDASVESGRASYQLPDDYLASTKEAASKVFVDGFTVIDEESPDPDSDYSRSTLDPFTANLDLNTGNPQFVVQPDQDRQTIWTGSLILDLNQFYEDTDASSSGSLDPNTFIFNGTTYKVAHIGLQEGYDYIGDTSDYAQDVRVWIDPALDAATYATWRFVRPGGEFNLVDALVSTQTLGDQQFQEFLWPETHWRPVVQRSQTVSLTGVGGTVGQEPEPDAGPPGIKLSWTTKRLFGFRDFDSIPVKAGFEIFRYERNLWGNFTSGDPRIHELLNCDNAESDGAKSCLAVPGVSGHRQSWTWTDETAQRGVSYLYTIKPYHEFYSSDGTSVWNGDIAEIISGNIPEPAHRVRIYGRSSSVSHRRSHSSEPGTPTNLVASQPDSGTCTDSCVRLEWDPPANATKYVVFRVGQRTRETWVDHGLTYPQQRFYPADPDLTVTHWEDTSAEAGVNYGYRVSAFNEDGLRSPGDAVVGIETAGGMSVPNRVRGLSAEAALKDRVKNTAQTVGGDASLNTSTRERFAQRFKTGGTSGKVRLRWIAVTFGEIQNVSTAADVLEATVNTVSSSEPDSLVCTLTDPAAYVSEAVNTYYASGCDLDADTGYFFVLKRTGGTKTIELAYTTSLSEDPGSSDWRIADSRYRYDSSGSGTWSSASQVHLIEVIHTPMEAEVTLSWTAPNNMSDVTGAKYEVQYRLDIPEKGEWDDDWKTLDSNVAASATSDTHTIALEKYYPQGGTTEPFELVPTADKGTLKLGDSDAENDLILPFGINYEYRVRGVEGANKGLPADTTVRIPNQDGLPPVVIIERIRTGCVLWRHVTDAAGNDPDGYRVLVASSTRRFHQAKVVTDYLPHHVDDLIQENSGLCNRTGYSGDEWQGSDALQRLPGPEFTWWFAVQAYNSDGIAKGDSTGGRRSRGTAEIYRYQDSNANDQETAPVRGSEAETID